MVVEPKPLVTFALIAYNQERYVEEAIAAALAQSYSPLEVILSDDHSADATFAIMQRAAAEYEGPHRIVLNRNQSNVNIGEHINKVTQLASGELIVLAAGDDISLPERTAELVARWTELGRPPVALLSDFEAMDASSLPVKVPNEPTYRQPYRKEDMARGVLRGLGATGAYSRSVFSSFPSMDVSVRHEDRVLPFRALLLGGEVALVDKKLVRYRIEGGISRQQVLSAADFLFKHMPDVTRRTLPDARQRLADVEAIAPNEVSLLNECIATIADHEARLELVESRGTAMELVLLKWLCKGARPGDLVRLYLKARGYPLYRLYFAHKSERK